MNFVKEKKCEIGVFMIPLFQKLCSFELQKENIYGDCIKVCTIKVELQKERDTTVHVWSQGRLKMKLYRCLRCLYSPVLIDQRRNYSVTDILKGKWRRKKSYGVYKVVLPGYVSDMRFVPPHIDKPTYYETSVPIPGPQTPEIKNEEQIMRMKDSCKLARFILDSVGKYIKVGVTTDEIDALVHNLIMENGAYPSPLNYHGFPKSVCTSVNNVACHGIPDDRPLEDGDIINVDITVYLNGYHGDCSAMFLIGDVDDQGQELVKVTKECLDQATSICHPGQYFSNIGNEVEFIARKYGLTVVPCFTGHGIGSYFHGAPEIYHCYNDYVGEMQPGMTFTIEPVLAQGSQEIVILEDGWTAVTLDNGRAAQWEHTVLITSDGVEVLTQ